MLGLTLIPTPVLVPVTIPTPVLVPMPMPFAVVGGVYVHSLCLCGYRILGGRRGVRTLVLVWQVDDLVWLVIGLAWLGVVPGLHTCPATRFGTAGTVGTTIVGTGRAGTRYVGGELVRPLAAGAVRARITGSALSGACCKGGDHAGGGGGTGS